GPLQFAARRLRERRERVVHADVPRRRARPPHSRSQRARPERTVAIRARGSDRRERRGAARPARWRSRPRVIHCGRGFFAAGAGAALGLALACGRDTGEKSPGASAPPSGDAKVAARVDGEPITLNDLRGGFGGANGGRAALENAITRRLYAEEARRRKLEATS